MLRIAAGMLAFAFLALSPAQPTHADNLDARLFHKPWAEPGYARRNAYRRSREARIRAERQRQRLGRLDRRLPRADPALRGAAPEQRNARREPAPEVLSGGPRPRIRVKQPSTVRFAGYGPGQIIIDHEGRQLFFTLSGGRAYRYPIAVGREGFQWFGSETISRTATWPDWRPPAEMRERQPELPKLMTGGLYNPLGYKALYLGSTLYRIHGTPNTGSIGSASSSGCFRMHNGHVEHLSRIAKVGTRVTVVRRLPSNVARMVRTSLGRADVASNTRRGS